MLTNALLHSQQAIRALLHKSLTAVLLRITVFTQHLALQCSAFQAG